MDGQTDGWTEAITISPSLGEIFGYTHEKKKHALNENNQNDHSDWEYGQYFVSYLDSF